MGTRGEGPGTSPGWLMSPQAVGGPCADTVDWRASQCGQVALCHFSYCFQVIHQGSTLSLCRGLAPGGCGSLLCPLRCFLKPSLIKKDGSAFHTLWVPAAVTCHPGCAPAPYCPSGPGPHHSIPQHLAFCWLSLLGVRRAECRCAHNHRSVHSANE